MIIKVKDLKKILENIDDNKYISIRDVDNNLIYDNIEICKTDYEIILEF